MPTTKKVAPNSQTKKGTPAAKSSSKTTAKKPRTLIKKSLSKSASSGASVLIKNNTLTQGKKSVSAKHTMHSKLETVAELHATKRKSVQKEGVSMRERALELRPNFALALLSPYRLPIDAEKLAINGARFGGVFFAALGAVFTLFFASGSFSVSGQPAALALNTAGTTSSTTTETTYNCDDPLQYLSSYCADKVDKTPDAFFNINSGVLSGTVRVRVKVPHAQKIHLNGYYKNAQQEVRFAPMTSVSKDEWELHIDTNKHSDGEYKLKVIIENGYGTYEDVHTSYVMFENQPDTTSGSNTASTTTSVSGGSGSVETSTTTEQIESVLSADKTESANEFRFEVQAEGADTVKISAYHTPSGKNSFLGYAYKYSSGVWKYRWLAAGFANGEYQVKAQVISDGVSYTTNGVTVNKLETEVSTESDTTTVASSTKQLISAASIDIQGSSPLSLGVGIKIDVKNAALVEMYARSRSGLIKKFLGQAMLIDSDTWMYHFNTKQVPNDEYELIAQIRNAYGSYEARSEFFKVQNVIATVYTPKQEDQVKVLTSIASEVESAVEEKSILPGAVVIDDTQSKAEELLADYKTKIDAELLRLTSALRVGDTDTVATIKKRLEAIKQTILSSPLDVENEQELAEYIDTYLRKAIIRVEDAVVATEKLITERTQAKADLDSDADGISDYDEVALYKTDPFGADTDGDGFIDSAEILSGYDPIDPVSETLVAYESPKDTGIIREDILEVTSIIAALPNDDTTTSKAAAIISGKAMPNSFVTLYIFSTPIVITLKTEADGSWNYRFDKELEDGEHEIYIGVTDNAGKIVAKSNPLTFVKEAEAFTATSDAKVQAPVASSPTGSLLSEYMVYLVLSISVVAIGLVLILLGLHLDSRKKIVVTKNPEVPV